MLVLGSGSLADECKLLSKGGRVAFFGKVSDTRPYLAASSVYIATSKAEGMPLSVLEAMALGLPVILSDIEPHQEILHFDSGAGFLAAPGSVEDTLQAMLRMANQDFEAMGSHSRRIIDLELNSRVSSRKTQEFYTILSE